MSWKNEKKELKEKQWEAEQEILNKERNRKEALSMYWRIDEAKSIDDIKDILERMREHLGLQ